MVSIVLCLLAGADIYATFGITFIGGWVGMVLTGVLASRGANYVADAIKRLQGMQCKAKPIKKIQNKNQQIFPRYAWGKICW